MESFNNLQLKDPINHKFQKSCKKRERKRPSTFVRLNNTNTDNQKYMKEFACPKKLRELLLYRKSDCKSLVFRKKRVTRINGLSFPGPAPIVGCVKKLVLKISFSLLRLVMWQGKIPLLQFNFGLLANKICIWLTERRWHSLRSWTRACLCCRQETSAILRVVQRNRANTSGVRTAKMPEMARISPGMSMSSIEC